MNETLTLALAAGAGVILGAVFFGGLWWTVQKGVASKQPALWFLGSLLLRMSIALAGFYFVSGGHWERLVLCLAGFVVARLVIARLVVTRSARNNPPDTGGRPCALLPIR
jgi:F1F0 ATPase subunit 2